MADEEQQQQTEHISYKDYEKKVTRNQKQGMTFFLAAFFALLLVFLGMAKFVSPDVEISLGDENNTEIEEEVENGAVDNRLQEIQDEDNSTLNGGAITDDGKVVIPKHDSETDETLAEEPVELKPVPKKEETAPALKSQAPVPEPKPENARVIVGFYSTAEQAEVAKGILQEAGLGLSPFIRKMGAGYTIQVGMFSSKEKAMNVANELLIKNYPARVIIEQK